MHSSSNLPDPVLAIFAQPTAPPGIQHVGDCVTLAQRIVRFEEPISQFVGS
jgi:hypothetical protein